MSLAYLASPYSKFPGGREEAFIQACEKAGELMEQGLNIFCPIAHSHSIENLAYDEDKSGDFWLKQDFAVLKACDKLLVYKMEGWEESVGVKAEIAFAKAHNIPIEFIDT